MRLSRLRKWSVFFIWIVFKTSDHLISNIFFEIFPLGDLDKDAYAIRYFISRGIELVVAQSFAKNFGLYNERVGNLLFVVKDSKHLPNIRAQLSTIVRANYSNPPAHGARIVKTVLSTPELNAEW